jgi:hypothetical protein
LKRREVAPGPGDLLLAPFSELQIAACLFRLDGEQTGPWASTPGSSRPASLHFHRIELLPSDANRRTTWKDVPLQFFPQRQRISFPTSAVQLVRITVECSNAAPDSRPNNARSIPGMPGVSCGLSHSSPAKCVTPLAG